MGTGGKRAHSTRLSACTPRPSAAGARRWEPSPSAAQRQLPFLGASLSLSPPCTQSSALVDVHIACCIVHICMDGVHCADGAGWRARSHCSNKCRQAHNACTALSAFGDASGRGASEGLELVAALVAPYLQIKEVRRELQVKQACLRDSLPPSVSVARPPISMTQHLGVCVLRSGMRRVSFEEGVYLREGPVGDAPSA